MTLTPFTLTAEAEVDVFRKSWWSRIAYRYVQLRLAVGFTTLSVESRESLLWEFLLPTTALDSFRNVAGEWSPSYDTMVEGADYCVWTLSLDVGGSGKLPYTLNVNLKPYSNPLPLLWHVCGDGIPNPNDDWSRELISLAPYEAGI